MPGTAFLANSGLALGQTLSPLGHSGSDFQALTSAEASCLAGGWGFPLQGVICGVFAAVTQLFLLATAPQPRASLAPAVSSARAASWIPRPLASP